MNPIDGAGLLDPPPHGPPRPIIGRITTRHIDIPDDVRVILPKRNSLRGARFTARRLIESLAEGGGSTLGRYACTVTGPCLRPNGRLHATEAGDDTWRGTNPQGLIVAGMPAALLPYLVGPDALREWVDE